MEISQGGGVLLETFNHESNESGEEEAGLFYLPELRFGK
jgi:hypothetical protein